MNSISYQAAFREPFLGQDEEREAIRLWQDKADPDAIELLLRSHARQVYSQAMRWSDNQAIREDLVAEGMIGLILAADRFDLEREVRFSTYAAWWIMTSITTALSKLKSVLDVPSRTYLDACRGKLGAEEAELALMAVDGTVTLDAPLNGEAGESLADRLENPELTPEEAVLASSNSAALSEILGSALCDLDPMDREVITRRRLGTEIQSVSEVASTLGISQDRVRQIEGRALRRLERRLLANGFSRGMLE